VRFEPLESRLALAASVLSFPFIPNQIVLGGAPIWLGIDATDTDPNGGPLTYSVTIDGPNVLQAIIPSGNKSLVLNTSGSDPGVTGQMTFQLFDNLAPNTTQHIETLVNNGEFATNASFYRIAYAGSNPFVIQGGPSNLSSSLGQFDDEYNRDLQFTSPGLLGMAKSTDDTNDDQIFVTAGPTRFLDFQHAIFGVVTEGDSVRQAIQSSRNSGDGPPLNPITIASAQIITDTQNAALELKAPVGASGSAAVTLTVTDQHGNHYSQLFQVTITPDPNNPAPFLDPIAPVIGVENRAINVQLTATDAQHKDSVFFDAARPGAEPVNYSLNVNHATGLVTITPPTNFIGSFRVQVGVRGSQTRTTADQFDIETILVTVLSPDDVAPTANDDSYFVPIDRALTVAAGQGVLVNDADLDGDPISAVLLAQPSNGSAALNADGSFVYTPSPGFHGDDSFRYQISDPDQKTTEATVTIHVVRVEYSIQLKRFDGSPLTSLAPGDDFVVQVYAQDLRADPEGVSAAYLDLVWDSSLALTTGPVQYGDFGNAHPPGDPVAPGLVDEVGGTVAQPLGAGAYSVFAITMRATGIGNLTFSTDPADLLPDHAVRLSRDDNPVPANEIDFGSASVTIATLNNHPPQPADDFYQAIKDATLTTDSTSGVLANDIDPDGDTFTAVLATQPTHGTVNLFQDGGFQYIPTPGFTGDDSFTYVANDGHVNSGPATVHIQVRSTTNQPPIATNDTYTTDQDQPIFAAASFGVLSNDFDPDCDPIIATLTAPPGHGSFALSTDGSFIYTPNPGFHGTDTFSYLVSDPFGAHSPATATINVLPNEAEPDVALTLQITRPDGTLVGSLATGDDFVLHVFTQDERPIPHGVFAAFLDVTWDSAQAVATGPIQYSSTYGNVRGAQVASPGLIDEAGGVAGLAELGGGLFEVFSIPMRVTAAGPGPLSFFTNPADNLPAHDVLAYGFNQPVPEANVVYGNTTVAIAAPSPPLTPGISIENGTLFIIGSSDRDQLSVNVGHHAIVVKGTLGGSRVNQKLYTRFVQHIIAALGDGNDSLKIDGIPHMPIVVDAGNGNDSVTVSGASCILLGSNGNDRLTGSRYRDLLIGGAGQDELRGNAGQDILIGGTAAYDENLLALIAIEAEWNTLLSYSARTANLASGSGPFVQPLGVSLQQDVTVFSDNAVDTLLGGGDLNWLFSESTDHINVIPSRTKRLSFWHN